MQNQRIHWIDSAKAFGIYLMVLGHLSLPKPLFDTIYSFHMPLFFFLAGMTFNADKPFKNFISRKFQTLIIPFYIFSAFSFVFWFFIGRNYGADAGEVQDLTTIITSTILGISVKGFCNPLWFLTCLFVTETAFFFLLKQKSMFIKCAEILLILICGLVYEYFAFPRLPANIDFAMYYLTFVALGYLYTHNSFSHTLFSRKKFNILSGLLCSLFFFLSNYFLYTINGVWYKSSIAIIPAVTGTFATIQFFKCLPNNRFVGYIGRNTLIILALHLTMLSFLKGILYFGFHVDLSILNSTVLINLILTLACIVALIPVIAFINRFVPWAVGRKKIPWFTTRGF